MSDINLAVPFFSQRNNYFKWENLKDRNNKFYIASVSCNITSLCMVLNFLGVTTDKTMELSQKVFSNYKKWNAELKGYDNLTYWSNLKKIPVDIYGVDREYIKDLTGTNVDETIKKYIENGYPIMFSIGTLSKKSKSGHIVVLRGRKENNYYIVNDPWGIPTNPFGELENGKNKIKGLYVARDGFGDVLLGKGNGDNCVLSEDAFKLATGFVKDEVLYFNGALAITYPFIYGIPFNNKLRIGKINLKDIVSQYKYNYLLSDNGRLLRGLEFKNSKDSMVYSCGSGRLIAMRNCKNISKNFILVQYSVPGNKGKYFYVNYKRLEYVDIEEFLRKYVYRSDEETNNLFQQMINKIKPKKVIYDKGEITGDYHKEADIPERGYSYIEPCDEKLKKYIVDLNESSIRAYDVNNINNYKVKTNGKSYYIIDGEKVMTEDLVPQTINFKEYEYYRKKIKDLKEGKIAFFCDEDYKVYGKKNSFVNKNNYKMHFIGALQDIFFEIDFSESDYENALKKIEKYYISEINKSSSKNNKNLLWKNFIHRCKLLCKQLLEIPWKEQEWAFSLNDKWFKGEGKVDRQRKITGNFDSLFDIYENIRSCFLTVSKETKTKITTWEEFLEEVFLFYPSSVDYYIEVSSNTILGKSSENIEIECFAEENLLNEGKEIFINNLSKPHVIKILKENSILSDNSFSVEKKYLTEDDVIKFNEKKEELGKIVLKLKNPFNSKFAKEFEKELDKLKGVTQADKDLRKEFRFLNIFKDKSVSFLNNTKKEFYYYNVFTFLEEMQKKQGNIRL